MKSLPSSQLPPLGVVFGASGQCRLRLGRRDAKACAAVEQAGGDNFCQALWYVREREHTYMYAGSRE